jgi:ribosomal protein L3
MGVVCPASYGQTVGVRGCRSGLMIVGRQHRFGFVIWVIEHSRNTHDRRPSSIDGAWILSRSTIGLGHAGGFVAGGRDRDRDR